MVLGGFRSFHVLVTTRLLTRQDDVENRDKVYSNEFGFYDLLKPKKASKFKKYFDQYCYVACFAMLFFSLVISMPLTP